MIATRSVVGVTTNPAIFQAALSKGHAYDAQIAELAERGADVDSAIRTATTDDVRAACDVLAAQYEASGGVDGRVSIEVDPRLAHDTDKTILQAIELWKIVDRPNLLIKIPATKAESARDHRGDRRGYLGERHPDLLSAAPQGGHGRLPKRPGGRQGSRPRLVQDPLGGLVLRLAGGHRDRQAPRRDRQRPGIVTARPRRVANARLAYQAYEKVFGSDHHAGHRFAALKDAGARVQRPLWASTGVKNPDYDDTLYVVDLVAPHTVNTMPEKTLEAVADHGVVTGNTIAGTYDGAHAVFHELTRAGIDLDDVFEVLETEGVEKFEVAWNELIDATQAQLDAVSTQD